ncbi:DUF262 domain-containing protein [Bacteroides sp. 519]|uniref:DUF262 domain-containing protein n=1 Tax=Bacteroides sp. 519 TaxID=2302937 RepID=UPI0013D8BF31|nr:DUF262 domain-containing protein [Bacteroides sp. 519]NDV60253.1 DUF262 domain-containing protein [Bacteroides sp. 519]
MKEDEPLEGESGLDITEEGSIYPNTEVRVEKAQYSILHLQTLCEKRKELIIAPNFQRNEVWKTKQASELIESILMGIPIPLMYLFEAKDGKKQVVDGRQRITAILDFMNNKLRLENLKILNGLNKKYFSDLEPKLQGIFEDYQLSFYIIQPPTPERIKYDIFDRVNRGGTKLNNQEMRNALYQGKATELIDAICESEEFKIATDYGVNPARMRDRYIVLRAIAFYFLFDGTLKHADVGGQPIEYKSDIDDFLAKVMIYINEKKSNDEIESLKDLVLGVLRDIHLILGNNAFRFESKGGNKRRPINMPLFESLIYLFLYEWDMTDKEYIRNEINKLKRKFDLSGLFSNTIDSTNSVEYRFGEIDLLIRTLSDKE